MIALELEFGTHGTTFVKAVIVKPLTNRSAALNVGDDCRAIHAGLITRPIGCATSGGSDLGGIMPTEPVLPENELRLRVVQRIEDGRLRCVLSTSIDAGYGTGEQCEVCDQPITPDKVEYDVTDPHSGKRLHFHFACHAAWQRECARRLKDSRSPTP